MPPYLLKIGQGAFSKMLRYTRLPIDKKKQVRKIILFKSGAIGDVLQTTPFVRKLRHTFPNATIHYWVGKWSAPVLENNPNIDKILTFDEAALFRKDFIKIRKLANEIKLEKYDFIFVLDKSYLANIFAWYCRIPLRAGFDRSGEGFANNLNVKYSAT